MTVADIARELHMSPANIYKFFPAKNAIIEAVGELLMAELHRQLFPIICARKSAWERIEGIIRAVNKHFMAMIASEIMLQGEEFYERLIEFEVLKRTHQWRFVGEFLHSTLHREIVNLLREGIESGEFRVDDTSITATALIDCFACSIDPVALIGLSKSASDARLERQFHLLARSVVSQKFCPKGDEC